YPRAGARPGSPAGLWRWTVRPSPAPTPRERKPRRLLMASRSRRFPNPPRLVSRPLKNVGEAGKTRQKRPKKRSLRVVNEHFEAVFNAVLPTQVVFRQPASRGYRRQWLGQGAGRSSRGGGSMRCETSSRAFSKEG